MTKIESGANGGPRSPFRIGHAARLGAVALQLLLLFAVIYLYKVESPAFVKLAGLAFAGAAVHHLLPARLRMGFFAALSLGALLLVFGPLPAAWIAGLGAGLIGLGHLPLPWPARIALLAGAAGVLAALRGPWFDSPVPDAVWPILGSMFMFRLIVYLYDLKHRAAPVSPVRALAYFFMLPNVCFPLFPVVDYKTFCRTYYNDDELRVLQVGVQWIARGVTQLLLYRLVYQFVLLDPSDISGAGTLFQYMAGTYLLYLRVSGQFHLIVGVLHLFGFNLPETNHRWLLASSFTDFWRRINIYWKEFITKVVFYPVYFRLKRRGATAAMAAATLAAFLVTWALHSYQWFWLRTAFPVTPQDILFWGLLALLVLGNVLWEARFGRKRSLKKRGWTAGAYARLAAQTVGTFLAICVLWSIWSAQSLAEWRAVMTHAATWRGRDAAIVGASLGALALAAALFGRSSREWTERAGSAAAGQAGGFRFWRSAAAVTAAVLAVLLFGVTRVHSRLGPRVETIAQSVRWPGLNTRDTALLQKGYYEDLVNVNRFNEELGGLYAEKPADWRDFHQTSLAEGSGDFMVKRLVAGARDSFNGSAHTINRWGMRDRDYERAKGPGVIRIAQVGESRAMGWGVADDETYENLLERRLNESAPPGTAFEVLNFAVNGYETVQRLVVFETEALPFDPDVLLFVAHAQDFVWTTDRLVTSVLKGVPLPYAELDRAVREAGVTPRTHEVLAKGKLKPHAGEVIGWAYGRIVGECRERGIEPCWVILPEVRRRESRGVQYDGLTALAREAGFTILDLTGAYGDLPEAELAIARWDEHPGPRAHALIADRLYRMLQEKGIGAAPREAEAPPAAEPTPEGKAHGS